jgi:cytidylate kinase
MAAWVVAREETSVVGRERAVRRAEEVERRDWRERKREVCGGRDGGASVDARLWSALRCEAGREGRARRCGIRRVCAV